MKDKLIIFGTGATSREIYYLVKENDTFDILGFVSQKKEDFGKIIADNKKVISYDDDIKNFSKNHDTIAVAIGGGFPFIKNNIYELIKNIKNFYFPNIISKRAYIKDNVELGIGNIIMENSVIGIDAKIENFNLFNTNSIIGHDTKIGSFNIFNPLCAISGEIVIKDNVLIGTGAKILQGLKIDSNSIVGAGAVATKDVQKSQMLIGIPAKPIKNGE